MASIFILCPTTRKPAYTGIEIKSEAFKDLPLLSAMMRCPSCGGEHSWNTKKALLLDRDNHE
jgi:hypothetical protein